MKSNWIHGSVTFSSWTVWVKEQKIGSDSSWFARVQIGDKFEAKYGPSKTQAEAETGLCNCLVEFVNVQN